MKNRILAIAAMDEGRVIGKDNQLPWRLSADMERFKQLTMGHKVLMGRKTYDSLPEKFKPLPGRHNVVVSRSLSKVEGYPQVEICNSLESYLTEFQSTAEAKQLWIIGGAEIYAESVPYWDELYLTIVKGKHAGDAYFPEFEGAMELTKREDFPTHSFLHYRKQA